MISFVDFKKMKLMVGKITSVEKHPNADKLTVMKIDIGGEVRQSVAAVKEYYTNEELIGKSVVVVENLEPAKLRGVESTLMLLAAQHGDTVALIVPEKGLPPGSEVL